MAQVESQPHATQRGPNLLGAELLLMTFPTDD